MSEETKKRAIAKAISFRALGTIVLATVSWIITGNAFETSAITIAFTVIQVGTYYLHERIWNKISWGKKKTLLCDACGKKLGRNRNKQEK